ncbi:hypothetical protein DPMN_106418, partial [Dreissena polymorpha]
SETHWSNEETMDSFLDNIVIPYVESIRENLPVESQALLDKLYQHNIRAINFLQPLDAIPNKLFKDELKSCFQAYYSDCVAEKIKNNLNVVDIDLRTSSIKEIHARETRLSTLLKRYYLCRSALTERHPNTDN